jgi:hypothetical protein
LAGFFAGAFFVGLRFGAAAFEAFVAFAFAFAFFAGAGLFFAAGFVAVFATALALGFALAADFFETPFVTAAFAFFAVGVSATVGGRAYSRGGWIPSSSISVCETSSC